MTAFRAGLPNPRLLLAGAWARRPAAGYVCWDGGGRRRPPQQKRRSLGGNQFFPTPEQLQVVGLPHSLKSTHRAGSGVWDFATQRAARGTSGAAPRSESPASPLLEAAGGQRNRESISAGPRRLAHPRVRPAGIPIVELPSPLGRASPTLLAGTPARRQDQGEGSRAPGPRLAPLAVDPWTGRPGAGAGRPPEVPPNPRLLLAGRGRGGSRAVRFSFGTRGCRRTPRSRSAGR